MESSDKDFLEKAGDKLASILPSMLKQAIKTRDALKLGEIELAFNREVNALLAAVPQAQQDGIKMNNQVVELEREIESLREQLKRKKPYALVQPAPGFFCFIDSEFTGLYEDARKLCCDCFESGTYSTLQQDRYKDPETNGVVFDLICNSCKTQHRRINYVAKGDGFA